MKEYCSSYLVHILQLCKNPLINFEGLWHHGLKLLHKVVTSSIILKLMKVNII